MFPIRRCSLIINGVFVNGVESVEVDNHRIEAVGFVHGDQGEFLVNLGATIIRPDRDPDRWRLSAIYRDRDMVQVNGGGTVLRIRIDTPQPNTNASTQCTHSPDARAIARRMHELICENFVVDRRQLRITAELDALDIDISIAILMPAFSEAGDRFDLRKVFVIDQYRLQYTRVDPLQSYAKTIGRNLNLEERIYPKAARLHPSLSFDDGRSPPLTDLDGLRRASEGRGCSTTQWFDYDQVRRDRADIASRRSPLTLTEARQAFERGELVMRSGFNPFDPSPYSKSCKSCAFYVPPPVNSSTCIGACNAFHTIDRVIENCPDWESKSPADSPNSAL